MRDIEITTDSEGRTTVTEYIAPRPPVGGWWPPTQNEIRMKAEGLRP